MVNKYVVFFSSCLSYGLSELVRCLEGRNLVLGNLYGSVGEDVTSDFSGARFRGESTESSEVHTLSVSHCFFDVAHRGLEDMTNGLFVLAGLDSNFGDKFCLSHNS